MVADISGRLTHLPLDGGYEPILPEFLLIRVQRFYYTVRKDHEQIAGFDHHFATVVACVGEDSEDRPAGFEAPDLPVFAHQKGRTVSGLT